MGEDIVVLGLFTLRDFNYTESDLPIADHLFCITYSDGGQEYPILLLWKRGSRLFTRSCHASNYEIPMTLETAQYLARLQVAAVSLLNGENINLLEI